ncbi:TRAP transporter small permease [Fulvimarina sp. MAC8]|uniref:TRAP transporter small permease subunit n=1 Tax=Fulvimarina sp. MAC8 TaxID=3162874 RepID=UPI0032EFEDFA
MRAFISGVSAISRVLGVIAGLLLFSAVLSVTHMVFVRYVLNASTVWQTEYTIYAIVGATFLGAPWTLLVKGHVNVDLLQIAAGPRVRMILEIISGLASLTFAVLVAYAAYFYLHETIAFGWRSETVWAVPLWMPTLPMVVGLVWLAVQYIAEILRLVLDGPKESQGIVAEQTKLFADTTENS